MNEKRVDLRAAILDLDNLPAMPLVAQKILRLPLDTLEGEKQLLKLIEQDPQISARIIGLANSPLFGTSRKVTSIPDASLMIGVNRIKSVSVGIAVMSTLDRSQTGRLSMQSLWLHSLGIAMAMCALARAMPNRSRPPEDEVFFAGLLHDIGFMVLNFIDPERSDLLQSRMASEPDRTITEIESDVIEIGHGELGAQLAQHWALPEDVVSVLRYHHTPDRKGAETGQPHIALLNLAEKLLPSFGIQERVGTEIGAQDWLTLGIEPARAKELTDIMHEQVELAKQVAAS